MNPQKGIAPIAIILIVISALVIGGGIYWWQKSKTDKIATDCIKEGETGPSAGINPESAKNLPTECCEGLKPIQYSGLFDENCGRRMITGAPSISCTKCGDGKCANGETVCNCPQDCSKTAISKCTFNEDEKKGWLSKIKEYIKNNTESDATKYNKIMDISEGRYQGKEVCETILDCCFAGDRAYIDKESGEIIGFQLGPE